MSYGEELLREEDKSRFIIDTVGLVGKSFINTLEGEQTLDDMKNPKIEGALKIKRIIDYNFMKSINEFNIFEDLKDDVRKKQEF